ncbi:hypothetical protein BGX34_007665 [Mortierella sp. NVP85]|nr:hypothetical protein BGX34_007665 [Mortierella sp. NVP85]
MARTNYRPRTITSCDEIEWQCAGDEIDLAVIILDDSQQLIVVKHQISADETLPILLKAHAKILMVSARYKDYESGVHVMLSLQNYTRITLISSEAVNLCGVPRGSYAWPSVQKLISMEESFAMELRDRADEVLAKIHSSL